jgi:glycosyltransferase involved in cell wall biosynthesis
MKIAFISNSNPYNKIARSGVPYSICKELSKDNEVIWIPPQRETIYERLLFIIGVVLERIMNLFGWNMIYNPLIAKMWCHSAQRKINRNNFDCIFTMGAMTTAYLNTSLPIFCRADSIAPSMENYYLFNIPKCSSKITMNIEKRALHKYTRLFAPSQWVIDEIKQFAPHEPLEKFPLIETGANLDNSYIQYKEHTYSTNKRVNLLFVGYDLKRKGIDEAFGATQILNEKYGLNAQLVIMGGKPEDNILNSGYVRYAGKKDKNDKRQFDEFYQEFADADMFIFPTKAECHGIVNCEAAAYGLPIFSYQTGGVPSYCIDNVNGRCLPTASSSQDFAKAIFEAICDGSMKRFSQASRKLYEEKFNWAVWGRKVQKEMENSMKNN